MGIVNNQSNFDVTSMINTIESSKQSSNQNNNYFKFKKKKDYKILNETKIKHQKS